MAKKSKFCHFLLEFMELFSIRDYFVPYLIVNFILYLLILKILFIKFSI